ncbi:MAG: aminoacyl-tRNA hydrolase [Phycisphaeraceae bacterium]|nr:aminoacyl-tRNA hydrolase [Phycisphaeraceae bacterium]
MLSDENQPGLELAPGVRVDPGVVELSFSSSSGPGGQNVNKRATRCQLRIALRDLPIHPEATERLKHAASHLVTPSGDLLIDSDQERSQGRNRDACFERLRELLILAMKRPKVRRATRPSRGSKERRIESKKRRGEIKKNRRSSFD